MKCASMHNGQNACRPAPPQKYRARDDNVITTKKRNPERENECCTTHPPEQTVRPDRHTSTCRRAGRARSASGVRAGRPRVRGAAGRIAAHNLTARYTETGGGAGTVAHTNRALPLARVAREHHETPAVPPFARASASAARRTARRPQPTMLSPARHTRSSWDLGATRPAYSHSIWIRGSSL